MTSKAPSYRNLHSSSPRASRTASRIKSVDTKAEKVLRSAIWRLGIRFRKNVRHLPGKPDIVFPTERVAIFCDGDFWHGRDWGKVKMKLAKGANSEYWLAKIQANRRRDRKHDEALSALDWSVLRFWESDILRDPTIAASQIIAALKEKRSLR